MLARSAELSGPCATSNAARQAGQSSRFTSSGSIHSARSGARSKAPAAAFVMVVSAAGVLYLGLAPGRLLDLVRGLAASLI